MIYIDRTKVAEPRVLANDNAKSDGERNKAIQHFEHNIGEKVDFKVYARKSVRTTLKTLFNNKCAYCESIVTHIEYPHIEHWRPKNAVAEDGAHKGYYWLASDWNNLLLACSVCNGAEFKGTKFPISRHSSYVYTSTDSINKEKPLLLNPCQNDPSLHLRYTVLGMLGGQTDEGNKSIEVYGLNRQDLFLERKKIAKIIDTYLEDIHDLVEELGAEWSVNIPDDIIQRKKTNIDKKISELKIHTEESFQYAGMTRYLISKYREKYKDDKIFMETTKELL